MCVQFLLTVGQTAEDWGQRLTKTDACAHLSIYLAICLNYMFVQQHHVKINLALLISGTPVISLGYLGVYRYHGFN